MAVEPADSTGHVVLLGDSVFDNAAYVAGGPDVVTQLRGLLPPGWQATLLALDGGVISGVAGQLRSLPRDATHLVISVGGDDALGFALFNDRITREVFARGISLLDLRLVRSDDGDYANPIEPSVQGGSKIAQAICAFLFAEQAAPRSLVVGA
jgi:hypothetical protein